MTSHSLHSKKLGVAAVIGTALLVAAPVASAAVDHQLQRGELLSVAPVQTVTMDDLANPGTFGPFDARQARYGVHSYRVTYRTVDVHGRPTTASGLVALPDGIRTELRTVAYEHGTRAGRADVASVGADNLDRPAALLIASAGYAAVAPDYLGLGLGPGLHPYVDAVSETTASVDLLRAARTMATRQHRKLDPDILVTGFSQGGQAAMALGRALQSGADPRLRLGALAPISGPYDVQHAELPGLLVNGEVAPVDGAFYLAYWTVAMNRLHHFYDKPSEVFKAPYDQTTEGLFDGNHDENAIFPAIAPSPHELFTDAYLQRLLHPAGGLLDAMRENDDTCSSWRPAAPVRLYAAGGDTDVTITNARHCQKDLRAHGTNAPLIDIGDVGHFPSQILGVPLVLDWFESVSPHVG
jgi:hypothetical protein